MEEDNVVLDVDEVVLVELSVVVVVVVCSITLTFLLCLILIWTSLFLLVVKHVNDFIWSNRLFNWSKLNEICKIDVHNFVVDKSHELFEMKFFGSFIVSSFRESVSNRDKETSGLESIAVHVNE